GAMRALLIGGARERLLERLQQRLRLELGLDGDLLGERDEEATPLDQPADDVLVAALDHGALVLSLLELALPVEDTRPGALRLRLGDHSRRLVEAREAPGGENGVRRE